MPECFDLQSDGPIAKRLVDRGMQHGCAIPIMPGLVGVIYLAWAQQQTSTADEAAAGAAKQVAKELVTR